MSRWDVIRDQLSYTERRILRAALVEFDNSDRWDEFDYDAFWLLWCEVSDMTRPKL